MTTYLGKSCSFCLPRVPFVNCRQFFVFSYFPFGFEGRIWDLIVSVPDHCLSFYLQLMRQERYERTLYLSVAHEELLDCHPDPLMIQILNLRIVVHGASE